MAHTHRKSTHHHAGTIEHIGRSHPHRKGPTPQGIGRSFAHTRHLGSATQVMSHVKRIKKAKTTKTPKIHNVSDAAASGQGDYAGQGAYGGYNLIAPFVNFTGAPSGAWNRHTHTFGSTSAGKPPGHGHTHKKGAGAAIASRAPLPGTTPTGGTHTHHAASHPGVDSRNYTPAGPHALQPIHRATPGHTHTP